MTTTTFTPPAFPSVPSSEWVRLAVCETCGNSFDANADDDAHIDADGIACCGDCRRNAVDAAGHCAPAPDPDSIEGLERQKNRAKAIGDWDKVDRIGALIAWRKYCARNGMDPSLVPERMRAVWLWAFNFRAAPQDVATMAQATGEEA